jgi:hypothetical protein
MMHTLARGVELLAAPIGELSRLARQPHAGLWRPTGARGGELATMMGLVIEHGADRVLLADLAQVSRPAENDVVAAPADRPARPIARGVPTLLRAAQRRLDDAADSQPSRTSSSR